MIGCHKAVGIKQQSPLDKSAQGYRDIVFHECSAKSESGCKTNGENPCKRPIYMSIFIICSVSSVWLERLAYIQEVSQVRTLDGAQYLVEGGQGVHMKL